MVFNARALAGFAVLAAASASQAAVTLYTNEASYLAAVGATVAYTDFAGDPGVTVSGTTFLAEVTFGNCPDNSTASGCAPSVLHSSNAITDLANGVAPNNVASLAWQFNIPDVYAFAFHYISGGVKGVNLVPNVPGPLTYIDTSSASGFIGLVGDSPFYGGIGVNAVFPGIGNDRYFINDFRVNAVPEPAAYGMAGLAVFGLLACRRRRG